MVESNANIAGLDHLLKDIIEKYQIVDHEIVCKQSPDPGEGFIGVVNFLQIKGKSQGVEVCLDLVIKTPPVSQKLREVAPIRGAFLIENYHYSKLHPKFKEMEQRYNVDEPFKPLVKCFLTKNDEFYEGLALQNLKSIGYSLWDKKLAMDRSHVAFVLGNYGRFHAMSFVLRHLDREWFEVMKKETENKNFFQMMINSENLLNTQVNDLIQTYDPDEDVETINSLRNLLPNMISYATEFCNADTEYSVAIHGDCWSNNMMFKYEDKENPTKPTDMYFLDWQMSRVATPIIDVSYFLYACAGKDCLDDLDHFLDIYYQSLSQQLKKFGLDVNVVFPFSKFMDHWRLYCKFGLIIALPLINIMLADKAEVSDMASFAENGDNFIESFNFTVSCQDELHSRWRDIVAHFRERKWL